MSQHLIRKCDICRRSDEDALFVDRFRVEREKKNRFEKDTWDTLDICDECLGELRRMIRNKEGVKYDDNHT